MPDDTHDPSDSLDEARERLRLSAKSFAEGDAERSAMLSATSKLCQRSREMINRAKDLFGSRRESGNTPPDRTLPPRDSR